jgi:uncharacterized membrane protein YdbT with pleckstrin-like domain
MKHDLAEKAMSERYSAAAVAPAAPAGPAERIVAQLRPHARRLFFPSLVVIATCGAVGYFYGSLDEQWQNLVLLAAGAAVLILLGMLPLAAWLGHRYTITTRRIILRHGFFVRVRQELLHSRGYDITVRKNTMQSIFGSGDIRINAGLETPVVLKDVPGPDLVVTALHDLMENSQSQIAVNRQQSAADSNRTVVWGSR